MTNDQFISDPQFPANLFTDPRVKRKTLRFNAVLYHSYVLPRECPCSRCSAAGKEMGRIQGDFCHIIPFKQVFPVLILIYRMRMGDPHRNAALLGSFQRDRTHTIQVAMDNPIFRMLPEEIPQCLFIAQTERIQPGKAVDLTAQSFDLIVVVCPEVPVDQEIKLYPLPVDVSQAVHQQRLQPAPAHIGHNLQNSDRHDLPPPVNLKYPSERSARSALHGLYQIQPLSSG